MARHGVVTPGNSLLGTARLRAGAEQCGHRVDVAGPECDPRNLKLLRPPDPR